MYKNVRKIKLKKSNRAVGSPLRNPRTVKTKVSNGPTGNSDERKTHRKNEQKTYQKEFQDSVTDQYLRKRDYISGFWLSHDQPPVATGSI